MAAVHGARCSTRPMERDLDRELRYHLDRRVEDLMGRGLPEAEARRQAALEFGGIVQVQEDVRDVWLTRWLRDARCGPALLGALAAAAARRSR